LEPAIFGGLWYKNEQEGEEDYEGYIAYASCGLITINAFDDNTLDVSISGDMDSLILSSESSLSMLTLGK